MNTQKKTVMLSQKVQKDVVLPFRRKPESRLLGQNPDPAFDIAPGFRRDDAWAPVSTGVTLSFQSGISLLNAFFKPDDLR